MSNHRWAIFSTALFVYLLDLITKIWAVATLEGKPAQYPAENILGRFLRWEFARNPGAAFSSFTAATFLLSIISIAVLLYLFLKISKVAVRAWSYPWGGLMGGILGNLTDRIFREPGIFQGHVIDWIGLPHWALFNIADSAIVLSVFAMALLSRRGNYFLATREEPSQKLIVRLRNLQY